MKYQHIYVNQQHWSVLSVSHSWQHRTRGFRVWHWKHFVLCVLLPAPVVGVALWRHLMLLAFISVMGGELLLLYLAMQSIMQQEVQLLNALLRWHFWLSPRRSRREGLALLFLTFSTPLMPRSSRPDPFWSSPTHLQCSYWSSNENNRKWLSPGFADVFILVRCQICWCCHDNDWAK